MSKVTQAARLFVFICLIVLAGLGIGLTGRLPINTIKNRKETQEENIELKENQDRDSQQAKL